MFPQPPDAAHILISTSLIDKVTMLIRSPELFAYMPFASKRQGEVFFKRVERIRNQIAHGDTILYELEKREEFAQFVNDLRKAVEAASKLLAAVNEER